MSVGMRPFEPLSPEYKRAAWVELKSDAIVAFAGPIFSALGEVILYFRCGYNLSFTAVALGAAFPTLASGLAGMAADTLKLTGQSNTKMLLLLNWLLLF